MLYWGSNIPGRKLPSMVVQLSPETCRNKMFGACMMVISEPKSFGAQRYVQALGENGEIGGRAYYRAQWGILRGLGKDSPPREKERGE